MATQKDIDEAVEQERNRCLRLLDLYHSDFASSSDNMMESLWCRIRNQISMGVEPDDAGFGEQFDESDNDLDQAPNP